MAPQLPNPTASSVVIHNPYQVVTSPYFSHVAQSTAPSNIVITAGQLGRRPDGSIPSDITEEIREAFANLKRCLEAAGAGVDDIMKLTYYIVDYDHANPRQRQVSLDFLGNHRPPVTLVPVPKLGMPGLHFEVEATAAIPQNPTELVDVVVVGAGLSGLQTAVTLKEAGLSVKVLEARDRVGGKTWSQPVRDSVCDVGAAWINDTNQSRMFALVNRFGLAVVSQNTEGNLIVDDGIGNLKTHPYGQLIADTEDQAVIDDVIRVRNIFEETCQKIDINHPVSSGEALRKDLDNITFEEWIRTLNCSEDAMNALKVGTRALLGVEPSELSALYFLDYCKSAGGYMQMRSDRKNGGQYLRVAQGTQSFSNGLASELTPGSVILQSPVRRIEQLSDRVRVISARGTYEASRVVVSVPTTLYKEIAFVPPLPFEKQELASSTRLGEYSKAILLYQRPWWRESGLCGLAQSCHGPWAVTRDSSVEEHGQFSLTCFITGQPAREWSALSAEKRRISVLDQIQKLFGKFAKVEEPIEVVEQIWTNEQWSQGCPCPVMAPGGLTAFEHVLRAPTGRIHFVGTETAYEWKGYMEGAVRSGERGAKEVLHAMNRTGV